MKWVYDDGGRKAAGFTKEKAGDCVARSIAIASGRPYAEVHARLAEGNYTQRRTKRSSKQNLGKRSADHGINIQRRWFKRYMEELGFTWVPCMHIGAGCTVHLRETQLPKGRLIVQVSHHSTAVIDHVIHDTYNPDRGGWRCVYGYWRRPDEDILSYTAENLEKTKL